MPGLVSGQKYPKNSKSFSFSPTRRCPAVSSDDTYKKGTLVLLALDA